MARSPANAPDPTHSEVHLKDYLALVVRRKWIIITAFVSVVASSVYYASSIKDVFESYATLVVEETNPLLRQAMDMRSGFSLSFYRGILHSRSFLEMVVDSIGMDLFTSPFPRMTRDEAFDYVQNSIELKTTAYNSFLRFNVRANTRELAYFIAAIGTDVFRNQCEEVAGEESRRTTLEIENQLETIRKKLEQAERDYRTYKEKTGDISEGGTPELRTLQKAYADNMAQLGVKKADLTAEKKQLAKLEHQLTPAEHIRSPEYLKLRSKLRELEKEKMRLSKLGIRLSGISTIDREIDAIERQLLRYKQPPGSGSRVDTRIIRQWQKLRKSVLAKEAELDLFTRRLESYKTAIDNYKEGNPNMLSQALELQRLKLAKDNYRSIYNFLLNKSQEERIRSASTSAGIKVVDTARMPERPIPKNESRYYILGAVLGLALGLGLAFFVEYNDTSIKSHEDVEKFLGVPVLGTIPHITYGKKNEIQVRRRSSKKKRRTSVKQYPRRLLNFAGDDSITTEAYRSLRTNLTFTSPDKPLRTVALTSAGPSEGKSLTVTNLAMATAQMGKKTLLVDTDLRRPMLHHLFNFRREPGFAELFAGEPDYAESIRDTGKPNLSIITAGQFTPNPAELVGSQKMEHHLDYFKQNFDLIFFDTPPVVAVTDASLLATKIDGVLLVVKSHHTDRTVGIRAVQTMSNVGVKLIGAVLNDIDLSHRYSSYGYYKYYYHYYKSKTD